MSDKATYQVRIGGKLRTLDRARIKELARGMTSGPEPGIANQIFASLEGDAMIDTGPRQTVEPDDLSPPKVAADDGEDKDG